MVDEASVSGKDGEEVQDSRWGRCGRPSGPSLPFVVQIIQDIGITNCFRVFSVFRGQNCLHGYGGGRSLRLHRLASDGADQSLQISGGFDPRLFGLGLLQASFQLQPLGHIGIGRVLDHMAQ